MDLAEIKELIELMRKNKIHEIDLEQEGSKVRILAQKPAGRSKQGDVVVTASPQPAYSLPPFFLQAAGNGLASAPAPATANGDPAVAAQPAAAAKPAEAPAVEEKPSNLIEIKSPMVGTFYRSPAPDAPPYVEEGLTVRKNAVLCIIEAMKLMNEIKSEASGRIARILVENGQPVEFNQPLFLIDPS